MIRVFPLISDATVSQNIIPGICKILERYMVIYKLDDLFRVGWSPSQMVTSSIQNIVSKNVEKIFDSEDKTIKNRNGKLNLLREENPQDTHLHAGNKDKKDEKEDKKDDKKDEKIGVRTNEIRSNLSLEPTWVQFSGKYGTELVGIKVIPVPITNPEAFISQIMSDKGLHTFERLALSIGNNIIRSFRGVMRGILRRPLRALGITFPEIKGDPFDDIILGKSKFGQNSILLLNYANIKNDEIFMDAGGLDKLFALGWSSIVIADDVGKKVIFCMKEFYGHCSFVPYSFIYQAVGPDAMKAYQDLETAKKSMSPFYQQKQDASKFFGESLSRDLIEKYSGLNLPCLKGDCK